MSKLITKFIEDNAVNDVKLRLQNNGALRARNAAGTADVEILKVDNSDILQILREMSMGGSKIVNLADPTAGTDAANKQYVDSVVAGLSDPKDAVRLATTAALPASTYDNGISGEGATLTADANGALPAQDGVSVSLGNRILVKDQASAIENGIYEITQVGDAGTPWILTRTGDADNSGSDATQVTRGMYVPVAEGSTNGSLGFILTSASSGGDPAGQLLLGTDSLNFAQMGEVIQAGQGLTKTGQSIAVDASDGLGFNGSDQLIVLSDDASLVTGTTKISGGVLVGRRRFEESFTLAALDITNGYVDLSKVASDQSIIFQPRFGIKQKDQIDFTVSYLGGSGGKTRITWIGDLASILEAGDIIDINFESLDY
jgi:hypothetical protein